MSANLPARGQQFYALNGARNTSSPAISLFVNCETREVDELGKQLSRAAEKSMRMAAG